MKWEELTSDDFARAVVDTRRTCVMVFGVLERHGPHMPVGTDMLNGLYVATEAAKREPAVVFPPWWFGQIFEARCFPGTLTIPPKMLLDLTLTVLDEIARNGFTRIIAYCAHGGNIAFGQFLAQCQLAEQKPFQLYHFRWSDGMSDQQRAAVAAVLETDGGGHAGEAETSYMLAHRPELVKMDAIGGRTGEKLGRMDHVKAGFNGFGWFGDHPHHWAGDARKASEEKGRKLTDIQIACLAGFIAAVKADDVTPMIAEEFSNKEARLRGGQWVDDD